MQEKYFKMLVIGFFALAILSIVIGMNEEDPGNYNVDVVTTVEASKGLDLKAVGSLLERAPTPEAFEKLLNDPKEGVNNLDLNVDGKVDFIKVTSFGEGDVRGFSLTTELPGEEVQEIATIKIKKTGNKSGEVEIAGNKTIYGNNHYHHSSGGGFFSGMMWGYLWGSSFRPYYSPWGYRNYPGYYSPYSRRPYSSYQSNVRTNHGSSAFRSSGSRRITAGNSPYSGRNATKVKARLKNPTTSQRSFQAKSAPSKRSGGFGRSGSVRRSSSSGGFRSGGFSRGGK